jgi:hypothetical protein
MTNHWHELVRHEDGSYTVTEKTLTEKEVADFREASRDDMPRGFFQGLRNVAVIWAASIFAIWMIYTLATLPGIP